MCLRILNWNMSLHDMNAPLSATMEAILFAGGRVVSVKRLASSTNVSVEETQKALEELADRLEKNNGGLRLIRHADQVELVTAPDVAESVRRSLQADQQGELSRPSLETLAILAYRGPLTRPELEQIRGVQSSLILRNLQIRGLVEMREESRLGQPTYAATTELLKYLGADRVESLPDYEELHRVNVVEQALHDLETTVPEHAKSSKVISI